MEKKAQTSQILKNSIITGIKFTDRPDTTTPRSEHESIDYIPENLVAFGYTNLQILNTLTNSATPLDRDPDKFIVYAPTFEEARTEFWARWSQYISRRFQCSFITIFDPQ
jgi:hypothetical protein